MVGEVSEDLQARQHRRLLASACRGRDGACQV